MLLSRAKKMYYGLGVQFDEVWVNPADEKFPLKGEDGYEKLHLYAPYKNLDRHIPDDGFSITITNKKNDKMFLKVEKTNSDPKNQKPWTDYTFSVVIADKVLAKYKNHAFENEKFSETIKRTIGGIKDKVQGNKVIPFEIALSDVYQSVLKREQQLEQLHNKAILAKQKDDKKQMKKAKRTR